MLERESNIKSNCIRRALPLWMPYCLGRKACKALLKYEAVLEMQPHGGSGFEW